jgi:hypothetical protein
LEIEELKIFEQFDDIKPTKWEEGIININKNQYYY